MFPYFRLRNWRLALPGGAICAWMNELDQAARANKMVGRLRLLIRRQVRLSVTGAPYSEVNSQVATAPKLKVEDKDRVNNSRRIKTVKLNIVKLKALLNKFSRGKLVYRSRMPNA